MVVHYGNQVHILAIDTHPEVLNEIARILHRVGYDCQRATNLDEAICSMQQVVPDLIIADANLGGQGGAAFCNELMRRCEVSEIPVLYMSSQQTPDIIRRADISGGSYYLRKPFDAPVFVELVERTRRVPKMQLATI